MVKNETGSLQDYLFLPAAPIVSGARSGEVWTSVIDSSPSPPNGAVAKFEMTTDYHALCGSYSGDPRHGGKVSISKTVPITLGSGHRSAVTGGSTVSLKVLKRQTCDFEPATTPGDGELGQFHLSTRILPGFEFTAEDVKNNHLMIGIATAATADVGTALATFAPEPNVEYRVQPKKIFFIAVGTDLDTGALVKTEKIGTVIAVDFDQHETDSVMLIHNTSGQFSFA